MTRPASQLPRVCFQCRRPIAGRARFCTEPRCTRIRQAIVRLRRAVEAEARCKYCPQPRVADKPVCERHEVLKQPCATLGCQGRIPRRFGPGRQPETCPSCDLKRPPSHRRDSHGR